MRSNTKSIAALIAILPMSCLTLFGQKEKEKKGKEKEPEGANLVENGSFEATTGKIKKLSSIDLATGWKSPTGARADLFMQSSKIPEIGVPNNFYGREEAKDGENYVGIVGYSYNDKMPRSYISTKLKSPLKKGMKYCVQFYLSLAELSKYSSNQIGVNISNKEFGTDAKTTIVEETHVLHHENKVFNAFYNWERVCGTYEAKGGEKYITIGNFTNNEATSNERNKKVPDFKGTPIIAAYYYIDDVSVVLLEEGKQCDCGIGDLDSEVSSTIYARAVLLKEGMTPKEKIEAQASFFAFGKNKLQPVATSALDLIADLMKQNPEFKLEVYGHCDSNEVEMAAENPLYENMDQKRIDVVVRYLKDKGIAENRIIHKPMGADGENPEILETDEEDMRMAKSRRIVYKVIQ